MTKITFQQLFALSAVIFPIFAYWPNHLEPNILSMSVLHMRVPEDKSYACKTAFDLSNVPDISYEKRAYSVSSITLYASRVASA